MRIPVLLLLALWVSPLTAAEKPAEPTKDVKTEALAKRPRVPGRLSVTLRDRQKTSAGKVRERTRKVEWTAAEAAVIICDMWNGHYCLLAAQRVDAMAPRMNRVITAARAHGMLIIHAPSGCMDVYAKTAHRWRMKLAPAAKPPIPLKGWCYLDDKHEAVGPWDPKLDTSVLKEGLRHMCLLRIFDDRMLTMQRQG